MEREIPKPPNLDPSFYIVQDGVVHRFWRLKQVEFLEDGIPAKGYYHLVQIDPPLDIAAMMTGRYWDVSEEDRRRFTASGLTSSAFLIMTLRVVPYEGDYYAFFVPLKSPLLTGKRFKGEECVYCGGWERLLSEEEALRPDKFRRKQEWQGRAYAVIIIALLIWSIGSIFHKW